MKRRPLVLIVLLFLAAAALSLLSVEETSRTSESRKIGGQTVRTEQTGTFDFFVLALSWSPSFCEIKGEQADRRQCGDTPHAFIVHGLWPQFESGYPEFCSSERSQRVPQRQMNAMFDLMPSSGLIIHQWRKHGTCSGMAQDKFFDLLRTARSKITVPPEYRKPAAYRSVDPDAMEKAFLEVNPGLLSGGIAVTCDRRYLREVRICMTRDLAFRNCSEVDRGHCRRSKAVMPPVRQN